MDSKLDVETLVPMMEECIKGSGSFTLTVTGGSMVPCLWPGRDSVILTTAETVKNHDVIFYRRDNGSYVLHRIIGIKKGDYVLCGDNQHVKEYPIRPDQVIAKVTGFYRDGRFVPAKNRIYRFLVNIWCINIRLRPLMVKVYYKFRNINKK